MNRAFRWLKIKPRLPQGEKRGKKVDLPPWLTPRRSGSEEEDETGDCEDDYEDEEEDPQRSSYCYPSQPASKAANEVCRTVVRTVTDCWPATITAVVESSQPVAQTSHEDPA